MTGSRDKKTVLLGRETATAKRRGETQEDALSKQCALCWAGLLGGGNKSCVRGSWGGREVVVRSGRARTEFIFYSSSKQEP